MHSTTIDRILPDDEFERLATFLRLVGDFDLTATDAIVILTFLAERHDLESTWRALDLNDQDVFAQVIAEFTGDGMIWCDDCSEPVYAYDAVTTYGGAEICEACRSESYCACEGCDEIFPDGEMTSVDGTYYCDRRCLSRNCTFCEDCDEYYHDDDGDDHRHGGCECEAPHRRFAFPANGHGTVAQNERLEVELPSGTIANEGIWEIINLLGSADLTSTTRDYLLTSNIRKVVENLDPTWQKKQGNYTRRLSKAMYVELGVKVPPALISEIGNIARRHTSDVSSLWVEFTRDLNGGAYEFYHDDSCWWGSHSESRCALKNWGGLGLRSYESSRTETESPAGRAWVQPLDDNLEPTSDTIGARAYVVYNGYGNLEGYAPARLVAHLTGKTYRKIALRLSPQYVNNDSGYLIADEATCASTESVRFSHDGHYTP